MLNVNWGAIGSAGDALASTLVRFAYYWPLSWRSISSLILGILLAKWCWVIFAPNAIYTAATPERASEYEAGRLFGTVITPESIAQDGGLPNVKLLGIFTPSLGRAGFAILKIDDRRQTGVAEGEEAGNNLKLLSVHADHVMLERGGIQYKITLENQYSGSENKLILPANGITVGKNPGDTSNNKALQDRMLQLRK